MKIIYFLRDITDCGGIQQTTCNIINSFLERYSDYDIETISLYHKNSLPFFKLNSKVKNIALFDKKVDQRWSFLRIKARISRLIDNSSFDLIIVQGTAFSIYLSNYIWQNHNVIVCEHGHYNMGTPFGLHAKGRRIALRKAKAIVSLTKLDSSKYYSHCNRNVLIEAIPNPYTKLDYEPKYNPDSKTIISVGTLDNIKQFDQAIETASIVLADHPDWEWRFFGDGPNKSRLQAQINKSGFSDRITLCGYENNKKIMYSNKSFLVSTSKFEGFGLALLEALQHRLPVISYDVDCGPKEIVQSGINGYLTKPNCTKELSQIISKLIENKEERVVLSKNSEKTISYFSLDSIINKWLELFGKIMN